jgi:hypothetical protein
MVLIERTPSAEVKNTWSYIFIVSLSLEVQHGGKKYFACSNVSDVEA